MDAAWYCQLTRLSFAPSKAGVRVNSLTNNELGDALIRATRDGLMRETAWAVGEKIRAENGCERTVQWLYAHLRLARTFFSTLIENWVRDRMLTSSAAHALALSQPSFKTGQEADLVARVERLSRAVDCPA